MIMTSQIARGTPVRSGATIASSERNVEAVPGRIAAIARPDGPPFPHIGSEDRQLARSSGSEYMCPIGLATDNGPPACHHHCGSRRVNRYSPTAGPDSTLEVTCQPSPNSSSGRLAFQSVVRATCARRSLSAALGYMRDRYSSMRSFGAPGSPRALCPPTRQSSARSLRIGLEGLEHVFAGPEIFVCLVACDAPALLGSELAYPPRPHSWIAATPLSSSLSTTSPTRT